MRSTRRPFHPRTRGALARIPCQVTHSAVSSPNTGSTSCPETADLLARRFIPEHGEHFHPSPPGRRGAPFHPRTRGALCNRPTPPLFVGVSSPNTGSTLIDALRVDEEDHFIPEHGEHLIGEGLKQPARPFHPRTRGALEHQLEQLLDITVSSPNTGSTWGLPFVLSESPRFIPEHGEHFSLGDIGGERKAFHPRTRGALAS